MSFRGRFRNGNSGSNSFNIPVGIAYQDILSQSQLHNSEVPKLSLPVNNSIISHRERLVASYCITHLNDLNASVFNLDDNNKQTSNFIEVDNSDEIERYGDRYLKYKKTFNGIESLTDHPFVKDLFPEELYNVMGFNKKKLLKLKRFKNNSSNNNNNKNGHNGIISNGSGGDDMNLNGDENGQDKLGLSMLEKLKELAEEVGGNDVISGDINEDNDENRENQKKSVTEEVEEDDDFEDDEDEDDDYNAEKYFNDGDDDDDDDGYGDIDDDDNEPVF